MASLNYRVHTHLNLIEVRPAGVVELSDILSYAKEILARGLISEGTIEYYDLSDMTNLSLDYRTASELSETLHEWLARGWEGSVFFAPQSYQFGMIRMIGAVAESIDGAPDGMMIPHSEPTPLEKVRELIAEHRRSSAPEP